MSEPYVGEIRMFAGNFPPRDWELCNGQLLPIASYEVLFQLIGTTYGGDGEETFALPDLRGRVPIHQGTSSADGITYQIGEMAGTESVTLNSNQIPVHSHVLVASTRPATESNPAANVLAQGSHADLYTDAGTPAPLAATTVGAVGGNQPHDNMQPTLAVNFIIATAGIFPSPT